MLSITRRLMSSIKKDSFFWNDINQRVLAAQYAVRGVVPTTANAMQQQMVKNPNSMAQVGEREKLAREGMISTDNLQIKYPFKQITYCNIGNPQQFHQKPITFFRQVVGCLLNPALISAPNINPDAAKRASRYLDQIISAGSYTHSLGIPMVRQTVSEFIAKSDAVPPPKPDEIFLTEGASQGVHLLFNTLITSESDSIMIPIPQYPLYTAAISLYGGSVTPYYLAEEKGWQLDPNELQSAYDLSKKEGKNIKALVVINPGNPTGAIFNAETIRHILQFGIKNKLLIVADEVYRENVYKQNTKFISFRHVLSTLSSKQQADCELASLHSVSKGLLGECGLRGGYLYLHNFNPKVTEQLVKLKSINLCSNSVGQIMVDLMCGPPLAGVSQQTKTQYLREKQGRFDSLRQRAAMVTKYLNQMKNISCNQVEGAMYAFPSIKFSQKAIDAAEGKPADLFYCLEVLKNTGIALVPGSGFRQRPGTYHFRITTLILPETKLQDKLTALKKFNEEFHRKYQ